MADLWHILIYNSVKQGGKSMPRTLSDERLNRVQYVSMTDYIRNMDALEDFEDKMLFTTRYLLAYGAEERDVPLAEAIHIAKMKIAEASAKMRENEIMIPDEVVNPHISDEEDAPNRLFMIEPVTYLQNEANRLLMQEANDGVSQESQNRINNYQLMSAVLMNGVNSGLPNQISELDIEPTARDVETRLKAKYGGARELEQAYNAAKPGFFSRLFSSSSRVYHNLDEAYNAFKNPDHALYGNMNALDKAATEYLKHCFPRWNPKNGMISKSAIERLSGNKKAGAMFSLNILKSTAEQRQTEPVYEAIITANLQKRADNEAQAGDEVLEEFQQNVLKDVLNEENELDSSQAEKEYHDNFVDGPEVEDDEPNLE